MSPLTSTRGLEMLEYLPGYYDSSRVLREILQARGTEFDNLRAAIDQILKEFFIDTASERGLDRWEDELGLARGTGQTLQERRERLKAKLRGAGTANKAKIKEVAESYGHGEVAVSDINDNPAAALPDYTVGIEFVSATGVPINLPDIQAAIRAVMPAHLAIVYVFNWMTWDELDTIDAGGPLTWDELDTRDAGGPHTWDEFEKLT